MSATLNHNAERVQYLYTVLKSAVVTEKSTSLGEKQQMMFVVLPQANKKDVKEAFEFIFKREVSSVNILNREGKEKRFKNRIGRRVNRKFAFIHLKAGQEPIDLDLEAKDGSN